MHQLTSLFSYFEHSTSIKMKEVKQNVKHVRLQLHTRRLLAEQGHSLELPFSGTLIMPRVSVYIRKDLREFFALQTW